MDRNRQDYVHYTFEDDHHICFYEAQWDAMVATSALRLMSGLVLHGPRDIHNRIHGAVPFVPVLSSNTAQAALRRYEDTPDDHVASTISLIHAIEQANRHPKARDVERMVGQATIIALEQQLPFIEESEAFTKRRRIIVA